MRCLHGSLADFEMGISSSPQVKHDTFFSGEGGFAWKKVESTEGAFLSERAVADDFARLTSVFAAVLVALRLSGGLTAALSCLLVESRRGGVVGLSAMVGLWQHLADVQHTLLLLLTSRDCCAPRQC